VCRIRRKHPGVADEDIAGQSNGSSSSHMRYQQHAPPEQAIDGIANGDHKDEPMPVVRHQMDHPDHLGNGTGFVSRNPNKKPSYPSSGREIGHMQPALRDLRRRYNKPERAQKAGA
jgi:hypothetical protein